MGRNRVRPPRADPTKPPRPRNAWMLFLCAYHQERTRKQELNLPVETETHQHTKIISQMWKGLTEEEKEKWVMAAEREKEEHARLYPGYKYQPAKTERRKSSASISPPPPNVPPPSSSAHPSVTKGRSNSSATKPKDLVLGTAPTQWDVPQAAKKAKVREDAEHIRQAHAQRPNESHYRPQYTYAPPHHAVQYPTHYVPAHTPPPAPAPTSKGKRGRPPKNKEPELIEEDIDNLELVNGQLVPKASGSGEVAMSDDEDSEDELQYESEGEAPARYAHGYQHAHPGYAYGRGMTETPEYSEDEGDDVSSQMTPTTPAQDESMASEASSSKATASGSSFILRPAKFD